MEGCDKTANGARGLCIMHYTRMLRHGDPSKRINLRGEGLESRFWSHVTAGGEDDCWEWRASTGDFGHGIIRGDNNGKAIGAHRVSWEIHNGPIPDGLWVLHHCDNPPCCNPRHLYVGTRLDNVRDMHERQRAYCYQPGQRKLTILTEEDVKSIRASYTGARGEKASLARAYGVSKTNIHSILTRQTWAWVDDS
jgi:hypothetical protein